jgi:hypothetical protein
VYHVHKKKKRGYRVCSSVAADQVYGLVLSKGQPHWQHHSAKTAVKEKEEEGLHGVHKRLAARRRKKKRGYRVCSSGYAATDTS